MSDVQRGSQSEQLPADGQASADPWQAASEQWWNEDEHARPMRTWLGIAVLMGLGLWFLIGCVAWAVWG